MEKANYKTDLQLCHQGNDAGLCLDVEGPARYGSAWYQGFSEQGWRVGCAEKEVLNCLSALISWP